ncbi:YolD-like family protein [Brevibacillus sp. H7]|jgi:hypothetical protein|uniref:YolD-like family protein n=1 Tax=Brevibacillus sp. H7 TaxID=3349138 RepID=UPI0038153475
MREKTVSKKENLFVASRFVLPEHRETYIRIKAEERRYIPPELDEEQQAALSEEVWRAFQSGSGVAVTYYDGQSPKRRVGCVVHVDQASRRIKLKAGEEAVWIPFDRLLHVQMGATS